MTASNSILVTGAGGLLGRQAVATLSRQAHVYAVLRRQPEQPLAGNVVAVEHDLATQRDPQVPETPETIVHLAQSAHYKDFPDKACDVFDVNVASTQRLLDWARRSGVKRFVLASTGGVYSGGDEACREDGILAAGESLGHYVASKRCAELLAEAYRGHMTVVILRFFFIYGQEQRSTMLIPRLVDNVRHNRPIVLQGRDGLRFNPIHVGDAARAVEAATKLSDSVTINVAGPEVLTMREVGTTIGDALKAPSIFDVRPDETPRHLIGDIGKMSRLLGAPTTGFRLGISQLLEPGPMADVQ